MECRKSSTSEVSTRTARCRRPLVDPASEEDVALIDLGTTTVVVALMKLISASMASPKPWQEEEEEDMVQQPYG